MRALTLSWAFFLTVVLATAAQHEHHSYPTPPEPAEHAASSPATTTTQLKPNINPVQLQREAREMLELSQSVQVDMDSVAHGLLPKDLGDKLKRIEKLSKHLRSEVGPR